MNISNNNVNLQGFNNRTTQRRNLSKSTSIYSDKEAVRIVINPRILASKEYRDILKEKQEYPIINPDVLLYDEQLYLKRYNKS